MSHPASDLSSDERQHMQWFHCRVLQSVSDYLDAGFWKCLIVPATWNNPAITHAVIALTSAHRGYLSRHQGLSKAQEEEFTLLQYSKAIRHLQPLLTKQNSTSTAVVLVACLLFTILEYTRKQHKNAAVHLHNGLKLLRDMYSERADTIHGVLVIKPPHSQAVDRAVLQGFATLHVQAKLFGNHVSGLSLLLQATESEVPFLPFKSLEEARDSLYKLLHGILLMAQRFRRAIARGQCLSSLTEAQGVAFAHLSNWRITYNKTIEGLAPQSHRDALAYMLLLNFHSMATIMCKCMQTASESIYNNCTDDFVAIIQRAIELWKHHILAHVTGSVSIIADIGWIPPLYYTALKCRNHRIRSHAIRLLRSVPHREGVWDSTIAAQVAEKVKELEEHDVRGIWLLESDFALDEVPYSLPWEQSISLPDGNLFQDVQVDLPEDGHITINCKGLDVHQSLDTLRYIFDGKEWHNAEPTVSEV